MRGDTGGSTSSCGLVVLRQPSQRESGLLPQKHTRNRLTCIIRGGEAQGTTESCVSLGASDGGGHL